MSRQYYESTTKRLSYRAYDLLLITGDDMAMKNPGRFEGDSCSDGYEDDSDPTRRGASEVTIVTESANGILKCQLELAGAKT